MFTVTQVILLTLLAIVWKWQQFNLQTFMYASPVLLGVIVGVIMGNVPVGMVIGGQMCLMSLGLVPAGGSSVPDYRMGTIAGTAIAIASGLEGQEALNIGLAVGVPVAALGTQLDVLGKTIGSFFIHKMMEVSDKKEFEKLGFWMFLSQVPALGLWGVPIILLALGSEVVVNTIRNFPAWLNAGLTVASGMLPALGFALLLRQMPMKKYGYFIILGYALAAYAGLGVLPIALIAVVLCWYIFQTLEDKTAAIVVAGGDNEDE
jgi:PTS system mannose-specific IIC component